MTRGESDEQSARDFASKAAYPKGARQMMRRVLAMLDATRATIAVLVAEYERDERVACACRLRPCRHVPGNTTIPAAVCDTCMSDPCPECRGTGTVRAPLPALPEAARALLADHDIAERVRELAVENAECPLCGFAGGIDDEETHDPTCALARYEAARKEAP